MREVSVIGAKMDIARGMPIIHLNLIGFHDQSHRRGPTSRFARWTLLGIDAAVRRVWQAAHRSTTMDYDVWIYSDHGQIDTVPYEKIFGKSIQRAVAEAFDSSGASGPEKPKRTRGVFGRMRVRGIEYFEKMFPVELHENAAVPLVASQGPMAHVYFKEKPGQEKVTALIEGLLREAHAPVVIGPKTDDGRVIMHTADERIIIPEQADKIFDRTAPFYEEMVKDFVESRLPGQGWRVLQLHQRKRFARGAYAAGSRRICHTAEQDSGTCQRILSAYGFANMRAGTYRQVHKDKAWCVHAAQRACQDHSGDELQCSFVRGNGWETISRQDRRSDIAV
jgi:hypothetical protein